jgi:choline dehydrogenase-like flavoprotein
MSDVFDCVVVGSGAGGAPLACLLCEAGWKVLMVERGKEYEKSAFDRDEIEWCRRDRFVPSLGTDPHTRRSDEGQRAGRTSDGWVSTVLGGGTVHMGAYLLRAHPDDARQGTRVAREGLDRGHSALDWAVPFEDIARFYDVAEVDLGVSGAPGSGLLPLQVHPVAARVDAAARTLGMSTMATPRGILTAPRADDDRAACSYRNQCTSYGCPNDAKSSMPATYLRRARRTGRLTVWTETMAQRLLRDPAARRVTGVVVRRFSEPTERTITASVVVVAAGAIESARLLLLSGDGFHRGGQVGKNLWFSLFVEVAGFFDATKHAELRLQRGGRPFINRTVRVDGTLPADIARAARIDRSGMLQVGFQHDNPIQRAERIATESVPGKLLWGRALKEALVKYGRGGRHIVVEGFGEMLPHPGTYVDLDPVVRDRFGLPVARITFLHHGRDQRVAGQMRKDAMDLLSTMGADEVAVWRSMSGSMTLQGGTCRMGDDPQSSVVDPDCVLHGTAGVLVVDGGALPSSLAAPPTLTIVANSLRTAQRLLARGR